MGRADHRKNPGKEDTRNRILDAAEVLFAEKGYSAVSVREITACAGCNLAAVNYHFGGKENLYLAVFKERWIARAKAVQSYAESLFASLKSTDLESVIRVLAMSFHSGPLDPGERLIQFQLMHRELVHPTDALELVIKEAIEPFIKGIRKRMEQGLGFPVSRQDLTLFILSMFGMIHYFAVARPVVSRLAGLADEEYTSTVIEQVVRIGIASAVSTLGPEKEME